MQELLLVCSVAFFASALTLVSGFGLGTILLPAFAVFFPVDIAIGLTAIVHFLNNIFKLSLLGKHARRDLLIRFGIPSVIASFAGAFLLLKLSDLQPLTQYILNGHLFIVHPLKLTIAFLLLFFSLFEIIPALKNFHFDKKYLFAGGLLSGFFGGLSGHQGALRSAFLVRAGLSKEQFLATGIAIACFVDATRLLVYSDHIVDAIQLQASLIVATTVSAFAGVWIMNKFIRKMTLDFIQKTVAVMLVFFALLLGAGII
jgi:uncharacterized protein